MGIKSLRPSPTYNNILLLQAMKDNVGAMMVPVMVSTCSSEECLKLSMLYIPHHTMLNLYILKEMSAKLTTHSMSGHVEGEGVEYHNGFTPIASEHFTHIIMHTLLYSAGSWFIHEEKRKMKKVFCRQTFFASWSRFILKVVR